MRNTTKNFDVSSSFSFSLSPVKPPFSSWYNNNSQHVVTTDATRHVAPSFNIPDIVYSPMDEESSSEHEEYCDCNSCQTRRSNNNNNNKNVEEVSKTQPYIQSNSQEDDEEDDGSVDLFPELDGDKYKQHPSSPRITEGSSSPSPTPPFSPIPTFRFPSTPYPGCINGREPKEHQLPSPVLPSSEAGVYTPIPVRASKNPPSLLHQYGNKVNTSRVFMSPYFEQTKRRLFSVNTTTTTTTTTTSDAKTRTSSDFLKQRPFYNYASSKTSPSIQSSIPFLPQSPSTKNRNEKAKRLDKLFHITSDFIEKITKPSTVNHLNSVNAVMFLTAKLEHLKSQIEKEMEVDTFVPILSDSSSSSSASCVPQKQQRRQQPCKIWTDYPAPDGLHYQEQITSAPSFSGGVKFHYHHKHNPVTNQRKEQNNPSRDNNNQHFDDIVDD